MERELILRVTEAEQELVLAVNTVIRKHSLPCFLVEPMIDRIHRQLADGKAIELAEAKKREASVRTLNNQTKESEEQ